MLEDTTQEQPYRAQLPQEELALAPNAMVDHFRIIRRVGRGGMGEVYLARDMVLGRKVALKVVRPRSRSRAGVQRFFNEARTTARFNHPHIVTIYAVGEHAGQPYLALEYLEGRTLRDRINEGQVSLKESLRIGIAIADALAEAHRHQVLHRDLKPENVVLPQDGRLRVVDFGLAEVGAIAPRDAITLDTDLPSDHELALVTTEPPDGKGRIQGTPAYMSPEQWAQEEVSEATDIWGLGVILYELAAGRRPYEVQSLKDLLVLVTGRDPPPPLDDVPGVPNEHAALVHRCLDKAPKARPSAAEVAETLREILATARGQTSDELGPFRGLQSYTERHAHLFFGRDHDVSSFLERIREEPVLPVIGPSGVGKSSLVQAGVIPRLREQSAWVVIKLRPGRQPFRTLAARLATDGNLDGEPTLSVPLAGRPTAAETEEHTGDKTNGIDALARRLFETPHLLSLALERIAMGRRARVLLFVDQLEELYTLVEDEQVRRRFMEAVCTAADDPQEPTRVIFTLREDFLGRLAGTRPVRDALSKVTLVASPDSAAMEQILVEPLRAVDYGYDDPSLVREMIAAAGTEPASLPLLQFAAHMLWERRDRGRRLLTREAYASMGGVAGALAAHADGVLQGLPGNAEQTARELLLRLVTADGTRRALPHARLLEGMGPEAEEVLGRLVKARLIAVHRAREGEQPELELVHESLIRTWDRLSRWIERSREDLAFLEEVGQAARQWGRRGRREDDLWEGDVLHNALLLSTRCTTRVPEEIREFLRAGQRKEERRLWRRRGVLALVGLLLVLVVVVFAYQKEQAERQRQVARQRWAEAQREGARTATMRGELLEARAKLRTALETEDSPLARALWWRLSRSPLVWRHDLGAVAYSVSFAPDGRRVAVACQDRSIHLFNVQTQRAETLRGQGDQVLSVAFAPAGGLLASGKWSGQVVVEDLEHEQHRVLEGHHGGVRWLAFSADGTRLASGSLDRTVRVWSLPSNKPPRVLQTDDGLTGVGFSPDGRTLACGGLHGKVWIWSLVDSGTEPRVFQGHRSAVTEVSFSPDGRTLASASSDRAVRLWDLATGTSRELIGHGGGVNGLSFSPDGRRLATASYDGTIRLWNVRSGRTEQLLEGHGAAVFAVSFSPDGQTLLSASQDKTIGLWRTRGKIEPRVLRGHGGPVYGVDFRPDGKLLATGGDDGRVRLWEVATGKEVKVLEGHTGRVMGVSYSPDGRYLSTGSHDRTVRIWSPGSGHASRVLGSHWSPVYAVSFGPDGRHLATGGNDRYLRVWDVVDGVQKEVLRGHTDAVYELSFGPDGKLASASRDRTVRLWDLSTGASEILQGHDAAVKGVSFGPRGRWLASAGDDGTVRRWKVESAVTIKSEIVVRRQKRAYLLDFHPDGKRVGVPWSDGTAAVVELDTGHSVELLGHRAEVNRLRFSHDGRWAATTSDDGTVRLWDVARGRAHWRAPVMLSRPVRLLTHRGWIRLEQGGETASAPGKNTRRALEQRALIGDETEDGRTVCLATDEGLELWEVGEDRQLWARRLSRPIRRSIALRQGCVVQVDREARVYTADGLTRRLPASAIARDRDGTLVASKDRVVALGPAGKVRGSHRAGAGVTALGRVGRYLALGFEDGRLELMPTNPSRGPSTVSPENTPSSPVVRIVAGPRETLVAGFANGLLGIWHTANGALLDHSRLHGPVTHIRVLGRRLYAATELGDHEVLDLSTFHLGYCELMHRVWQEVPVVWENGQPVLRSPPEGHPCLPSR